MAAPDLLLDTTAFALQLQAMLQEAVARSEALEHEVAVADGRAREAAAVMADVQVKYCWP